MATEEQTAIGNDLKLQVGDGNSPEEFVDFCAVFAVEGLGETKPLVDVTTMCNDARSFRGGLAEGNEFSISANLIQGEARTRELYQSYRRGDIINWRLPFKDVSPEEFFAWSTVLLGWTLSTPIGDKATIVFQVKVTGDVDWVYT